MNRNAMPHPQKTRHTGLHNRALGTKVVRHGVLIAPFLVLWWVLMKDVSVVWDLNPQYSYGWLMPFLCVGLFLRRRFMEDGPTGGAVVLEAPHRLPSWVWTGCILLIAGYLPTRLVQESTPEWRLVSWALGAITIGCTILGVYAWGGPRLLKQSLFPLLFFLVAIPWPTFIEGRLIQGLTQLNSCIVIEVLTVLGIPAVQHGNLIEVGTGTVGVEEACSGIRSFQSSLMVSLFLGEYLRLRWCRRAVLVPLGFAVAFVLNVVRTTFLTYVAASHGVERIESYHDPAGLAILVACCLVLWAVGWWMLREQTHRVRSGAAVATPPGAAANGPSNEELPVTPGAIDLGPESVGTEEARREGKQRVGHSGLGFSELATGLLVWVVIVEAVVAIWYHTRESGLVKEPAWSVHFPSDNQTYEDITLHPTTVSLLRFDEGRQGRWLEADGTRWMGFYFDWKPGRVAGYLAKRHTPETCLPAGGAVLRSGPELMPLTVHGIFLPMKHYVFEHQGQHLQVFQCRWEAGATPTAAISSESETVSLIRGIWAGRGKQGQKVLEFIVSGSRDANQAKADLALQLQSMIKLEDGR